MVAYGIGMVGLIVSACLYLHVAAKYLFVRILRNTSHLQANTVIHWGTWLYISPPSSFPTSLTSSTDIHQRLHIRSLLYLFHPRRSNPHLQLSACTHWFNMLRPLNHHDPSLVVAL